MTEKTEKQFIEGIIGERMALHYRQFQKEHPSTPKQEQAEIQLKQAYEKVRSVLDKEHQRLLNDCVDRMVANVASDNELYYRAGFEDGIRLDYWIKNCKEKE